MARRRWWVVGCGAVGGLLGVALLGAAGFGVWLTTAGGEDWLRTKVEGALTNDSTTASVGAIHTDLWTGARIEDFELRTETLHLKVGRLDADLDRSALLGGKLAFSAARADGVFVDLTAPSETSEDPFTGIGIDLAIRDIDLRGANVIYRSPDGTELVRVVGASGKARFEAVGPVIRVENLDVRALLGLMGAVPAHVRGAIEVNAQGTFLEDLDASLPRSSLVVSGSIQEELSIDIDATRLQGADLDQILGNPGLDGVLRGAVTVRGPTDQIRWQADMKGIEGTQGAIGASGGVDLREERLGWTVDATLDEVDARQLYPALGDTPVVLTGRAVLDGKGTSWPDDLDLLVDWEGSRHDAFGQTVDAATARVRISKGVVTLENSTLDGILGELSISGTVDAVNGPMDLRATGTIRPARLRELGVSGVDSSGWVDARIRGDISDPANEILVDGTVRFRPFRSGESIRFDELFASYRVAVNGDRVSGTAQARATGGDISGIAVASAVVDKLSFEQSPAGIKVAGDLLVSRVQMPDTFSAQTLTGMWTFRDSGATATLSLGEPTLLGHPGTGGQITVDLNGDDLAFSVAVDADPEPLLETNGQMNLARSEIVLDHLRLTPSPEVSWTDVRPLRLRLIDGGIADADIALRGDSGRIELTGLLGTNGPLDGTVKLRGLALDAVARLLPGLDGLDGVMDLDVALSGDASAAQITGEVHGAGLAWADSVRELDLEGSFSGTGRTIELALELGSAGDPLAHVHGDFPLLLDLANPRVDLDGRANLTLALVPGPFDRLATVAPAADDLPQGRGGMVLQIRGPVIDPDLRLAGVVEAAVPGWDDLARLEFELNRADGSTSGWADLRRRYQALAQSFTIAQLNLEPALRPLLSGESLPEDFDRSQLARDLYITGALLEIPVGLLAASAGVTDVQLRGKLTGGFQLSGTPSDPVADVSINWVDGRIGRQPLDGMDLQLTHTDTGYDVDMEMRFPDGGDFTVKGGVPIDVDLGRPPEEWSTGEMDLVFGGSGIPLRVVTAFDPGLTQARGLVKLTGRLGGSPTDPDPQLQVLLKNGALTMDAVGLRMENVLLRGHGDRNTLVLDEISGTTRPSKARFDLQDVTEAVVDSAIAELDPNSPEAQPESSFKGAAEVKLVDGSIGEISGRMRLNNGTWVIHTPDLQMRLDGRIRAAGTWPAIAVGGDLSLRQGLVKLDAAAFVDRAPLEPDPRIRIVRSGTALTTRDGADAPWYGDFTASVALDLRRALQFDVSMPFVDDLGSLGAFVSRADLFARLGGQTQLSLSNGEPTMVGELELNDGRLKMLGRRFDVEDGKITFTGGDIAEPRLDITAKATVAQVPITARVSGTPSKPAITPDCEGYPSQSDCLMILVTGSTPDGESDGNAAGALAGMALGGVLGEQSVADVSIEPDGTIQAGAAITNSVYATYSIDPRGADPGENQSVGELDIGLARRVVLNVAVGDTKSWLDLFWEIRF